LLVQVVIVKYNNLMHIKLLADKKSYLIVLICILLFCKVLLTNAQKQTKITSHRPTAWLIL